MQPANLSTEIKAVINFLTHNKLHKLAFDMHYTGGGWKSYSHSCDCTFDGRSTIIVIMHNNSTLHNNIMMFPPSSVNHSYDFRHAYQRLGVDALKSNIIS